MQVTYWFETVAFPVLACMTLLPLVGAGVLLKSPKQYFSAIAFTVALLNIALSIFLLVQFDTTGSGIQLAESVKFLGMSYSTGVDGSNILFIPLVTVLTLLCLVYKRLTPYADNKGYIACLLLLEGIFIGAFAALNLLQFWFWLLLELGPILWLTVYAGTGTRTKSREAALLLLRYWGSGLLMILVCFLLIGFDEYAPEEGLTFDWVTLLEHADRLRHRVLIFLLLFFGLAIRMPLFPFHGWLPVLAERGTVTSVAVYLVGLKLGVYGVVRFILPLVPNVARQWEGFVLTLGVISIFYGALLALMQLNIRRLIAFAVISHTGLLIIGVFSFTDFGLEGSILLSIAYGLATAGMLFSIGLIYQRTGTAWMPRLGGLFDTNTSIALLFLVSALSTMVMPGTPGYDAAHLLLEGVIEQDGWLLAITILTGNLFAAAFLLWAFQQIFIAQPRRAIQPWSAANHPVREELFITLVICTLLIITGFYTTPELNFIDQGGQ